MRTRISKPIWLIALAMTLIAALACGLPGQTPDAAADGEAQEQIAVEATGEEPPEPTPTEPPPTEILPTAEPVALDTCSLLTADDLQAILGEAPVGTYDPNFASCMYATAAGGQLIISAYQGELAREKTNEGMTLALQYLGTDEARQMYDELSIEDMTIAEMADAFAGIEAAMGREVTPQPNLGDAAYLVWIEPGSAQLGVARGETVTAAVTIGIERTRAEEIVLAITDLVWDRLPEQFAPAP